MKDVVCYIRTLRHICGKSQIKNVYFLTVADENKSISAG